MFKKVLILLIVLDASTSVVCFSQATALDKKLSINIQNQPLSEILRQIEKVGGVSFSYNSTIIKTDKTNSINALNQTLKQILTGLFGLNFTFTAINNQILITVKTNQPQKITGSLPKLRHFHLEKEAISPPDTNYVVVYDTLYTTITDTMKVMDTILVKRIIKTPKSIKSKYNISYSYLPTIFSLTNYSFTNNNQNLKDFIKQSESNYQGYSAGISLDYGYKSYNFKIGLMYTNLTKNISYNFRKEYTNTSDNNTDTVGLWTYKTVLTYYKFKGGDTVLVPIIDSAFVTKTFKHTKQYVELQSFKYTNNYHLLQIPLSIGYPIGINKRNWITPNVQVKVYYMYGYSGYYFDGSIEPITKTDISKILVSLGFSVQYGYRIHNYATIFVEPTYTSFVNNIYSHRLTVNERLSQCGIAFGIRTLLYEKK